MKSAIVCLVIVAVFVYVNAMPADGDTTPAVTATTPAVTATTPNASSPSSDTTTPAGEETTEPSSTPKPFNPMELFTTIAKDVDTRFKSFFGQFPGTG